MQNWNTITDQPGKKGLKKGEGRVKGEFQVIYDFLNKFMVEGLWPKRVKLIMIFAITYVIQSQWTLTYFPRSKSIVWYYYYYSWYIPIIGTIQLHLSIV